jgi:hypothetical protein
MHWKTQALSLAVALAVIVSLPGCGGGGGSPTNPTPTPTPGPIRTLIGQGAQSDIPPVTQGVAYFLVAQINATATLEATVDWTFPSNPVALVWAQGNCIENPNCAILVQDTTTAKPKTLTASNLAAGTYTLAILNLGTTNESVSYQIFLIR